MHVVVPLILFTVEFIGNIDPVCIPNIYEGSNSQLIVDGFIYLECDFSSCDGVSKITFEKTGVHSPTQWTPVFEGVDQTKHRALKTGSEYTLLNRNDYLDFESIHVLYVSHLTGKDNGNWRCAVHYKEQLVAESQSMGLNVLGFTCKPVILEGSSSQRTIHGFIFIECDFSTCQSVSKVIYEKTGIYSPTEWTPVFEGTSKAYYKVLDTGSEYTLLNRNDFMDFDSIHVLYVGDLTLKDEGKWRCVVHYNQNRVAESFALGIFISGTKEEDSVERTCPIDSYSLFNEYHAVFFFVSTGNAFNEPRGDELFLQIQTSSSNTDNTPETQQSQNNGGQQDLRDAIT